MLSNIGVRASLVGAASLVSCYAHCDDRFAFQKTYRGQLTPERKPGTGLQVSGGGYGSRWLRLGCDVGVQKALAALDDVEKGAAAAVYVGLMDVHPESGKLVAALRHRGYRFYHCHAGDSHEKKPCEVADELVYFAWRGAGENKVPPYSTCYEGVGALVLSPDRTHVLLVWEYGHWKLVTGNVDTGEGWLEALRREVREEVNVLLSDEVVFLGGWQDPKCRDDRVNNTFAAIAVTAATLDFKVDGDEIEAARWFPLSSLPSCDHAEALLQQDTSKSTVCARSIDWNVGIEGKNKLSINCARWLNVLSEGRGLAMYTDSWGRVFLS